MRRSSTMINLEKIKFIIIVLSFITFLTVISSPAMSFCCDVSSCSDCGDCCVLQTWPFPCSSWCRCPDYKESMAFSSGYPCGGETYVSCNSFCGCTCRQSCGAECDADGDCPDSDCTTGNIRWWNGFCDMGPCTCKFSNNYDCDNNDYCFPWGTGCEYRNYYCDDSDGSADCEYTPSNQNADTDCSYTGCSPDDCTRSGTRRDYECDGASCTYDTLGCNDDCDSGEACSGGSCSSSYNCGTENCPSDDCLTSPIRFRDYPSSCYKKCDGSGNCVSCCSPSITTCPEPGCCDPSCTASSGCGTTDDNSECSDRCVGTTDTREYNRPCNSCACGSGSTQNCALETGCGECGCPSTDKPDSCGCSGGSCVNSGCTPDSSCCGGLGQSACNAAASCTWCTGGSGSCIQSSNWDCEPPDCGGSGDMARCTDSCSWRACGTESCPSDQCVGTTWRNYPSSCTITCRLPEGTCRSSCSCSYTSTTCDSRCYSCGDGTCDSACGETAGNCAPDCSVPCTPDGCNANCPSGCSVAEDPDCGCQDGDGCCGIGCDASNDNDCAAVCTPDGCNANCPSGCSVAEDPDCGCQDGDGCCGMGCDNSNDDDCPLGMCSLTTSSLTPNCAGGSSTDCEIGETIDMSTTFEGASQCNVEGNLYFRINVKSLDNICDIEITTQGPSVGATNAGQCGLDWGPTSMNFNGDGTCTASTTPNFDVSVRRLWGCDDPPNERYQWWDTSSTLSFGYSTTVTCDDGRYRGYAEWIVWTLADNSIVKDSKLRYHNPSSTGGSYISAWPYTPSKTPPSGITATEVRSCCGNDDVYKEMNAGQMYAQDGFPSAGTNQEFDMGPIADADIEAEVSMSGYKWFAIGLNGPSSRRYIYSEDYDFSNPEPTLVVTFIPPFVSDTWSIPSIPAECGGKTVYAYQAELWDGQPGIGTLISRASDSVPDDSSPVDGSFTLGSVVCTPDGCNGNCPAGCSSPADDPDCGCVDSDGICCSATCNSGNDNDCAAPCFNNGDCADGNICTVDVCQVPGTPSCSNSNRPNGYDCGDCRSCSSGACIDNTQPSCVECENGPFCNPVTDIWYCTDRPFCQSCTGGNCDGFGSCISDLCGDCKYCSVGSCVDRADGYNDCGSGCERCVSGSCQDYNQACSGTIGSCYCSSDVCQSCTGPGCCDASCQSFSCINLRNDANCLSYQFCDTPACSCEDSCSVGAECFRGGWECDGDCQRRQEVRTYDGSCNCVFDHNDTQNVPVGQHCVGGSFTSSGYCAFGTPYCSGDRYLDMDVYECGATQNCDFDDGIENLNDCGADSYSCADGCTRRYTYTCDSGACGTYNIDNNCPLDTACSGTSCSVNNYCYSGSDECIDSCESGGEQRRCDGSGNCNRFWQWVNNDVCDPFGCSAGSCTATCDSACGSDAACDGLGEGDSCGIGRECQSCQCVAVACSGHYNQGDCGADPSCAWCTGDDTCYDTVAVECQPGAEPCSGDQQSRCTSDCAWLNCGSSDSSCYCSGGNCMACLDPTPICSNYQCVECLQDDDCECYEKCNLALDICYDLRYECDDGSTGAGCGIEGACQYFDNCFDITCASNPFFCFNADGNLCSDSRGRCNVLWGC